MKFLPLLLILALTGCPKIESDVTIELEESSYLLAIHGADTIAWGGEIYTIEEVKKRIYEDESDLDTLTIIVSDETEPIFLEKLKEALRSEGISMIVTRQR